MGKHVKKSNSQIFQRFINYTESLKDDPSFKSEIKWLRSQTINLDTKKPIPAKGIPLPKNNGEWFSDVLKYDTGINDKKIESRKTVLIEKYPILNLIPDVLEDLIVYNSISQYHDEEDLIAGWYARIADFEEIRKEIENKPEMASSIIRHYSLSHPVALFLNPYMSERSIVDFVKKFYKNRINPIQEKYLKGGINPLAARGSSKKNLARDEFIYRNRKKTLKDLIHLVAEKFGKVYDYSYIQAIIRKERQKRK